MESELLKGLTKNQIKAVTYDRGPVLVVAGAGTGKTTVITRRIAWLIEQKMAKSDEILALTFTEKAAIEMEERVDELVPYGFVDTWISTFHAFGDRVLRDHAIELDLPVDFRVLSESEQLIFFREHLFDFSLKHLRPLNNPARYAPSLLKYFQKIKDEDIAPERYIEFAKQKLEKATTSEDREAAEIQLEIALCFKEYNDLLHQNGYVDFGDQISLTLRLFRENPRILKKYQNDFKYLLVDEFQDTNFSQNELLKILAPKDSNLMVVGDDDQSIYRFRGAALSNILDFIKNWPKAKQIVLTENYRSGKSILDSSYKLITQNNPARLEVTNKIDKKLIAAGENLKSPGKVEFIFTQTFSAEADRVAEQIKAEKESGTCLDEIAILVRRNADAETFAKALTAKGIPSKVSGNSGLYTRPEILNLINFIKSVADPSDNLAHFYLVTSDIYGLSLSDAIRLNSLARKGTGSLEDTYRDVLDFDKPVGISAESSQVLARYIAEIDSYREKSKELTAGQLVYYFLTETGYLKSLLKGANKDADDELKIQNISQFFEKIKGFDLVSEDKSIHNFFNNLSQLLEVGENPGTAEVDNGIEAVNILTVHKSKGLEFDVVFIVNLVNGAFPGRRQHVEFAVPAELTKEIGLSENSHLEEERRLFYVAMTRAKKRLFLSASEDHGGKRKHKISQFVLETLGQNFETSIKHKLSALEKISSFAVEPELEKLLQRFYHEGKTLILTPHQIDDYLSCPLKFKYVHVFRIPLMKNHAIIYGSAIHSAVQYYYEAKARGKNLKSQDLIKVFEDSWSKEGFYTRKHEEDRFAQGRETLIKFFNEAEKIDLVPSKIEEPFSFVLGGGDQRVKINGRYDAVYISEEEVEIKDFKTASVKSEKDALKRAADSNQLSIYALSWRENYGTIPDSVSLHFVDSGIVGGVKKTDKQLDRTAEEIEKVSGGIRQADFAANPKYGECDRCAFKAVCPFRQ